MVGQQGHDYAEYVAPEPSAPAYHCPICGVYSRQVWFLSARLFEQGGRGVVGGPAHDEFRFMYAMCDCCNDVTIWREGTLVYPQTSTAPRPHRDMPVELQGDYAEAREVLRMSPRAAAALLRLATEKLALYLLDNIGVPAGENLNDNIGLLVKNGLPSSIQKALDSLRVIGNEAVHPGMIDLKDDETTALSLFKLLNIIVENRITEVNEIEKLYAEKVADTKKDQIQKRDAEAKA